MGIRGLNLGPRLTLCFALIIAAMLGGNGVLLWQFQRVRNEAGRRNRVDEELIVVLQAHTSLMSFYEKVDELAQSRDTAGMIHEAELLGAALLEDRRKSTEAFGRLRAEAGAESAIATTLEAIQGALPEQLEGITALARAQDWDGVHQRLVRQVRPLEFRIAALAASMDREAGDQRARALETIR